MNSIFYKAALLFIVSAMFSCVEDPETEQIGPDLDTIYSPVQVLSPFEANRDTLDYSSAGNDTIFFTAAFSRETDWEIVINGNVSYTLNGRSDTIGLFNNLWTGEANNYPGFTDSQTVSVTLRIPSDNITIGNTSIVLIDKANIADRALRVNFAGTGFPDLYPFAKNLPSNTSVDSSEFVGINGNGAIYIEGVPKQGDGQFVNGCGSRIRGGGLAGINTDSIYVNLAVYGYGKAYTLIRPEITERHSGNQSELLEAERDIATTWTGWRIISWRYSEFTLGAFGSIADDGLPNNPETLFEIKPKVFTANEPTSSLRTECAIGMVAISVGKPLTF